MKHRRDREVAWARVIFTPNLTRHISCPASEAEGRTVGEVLESIFAANPLLRSYVLDDQACLRRHMSVFIDGRQVRDRIHLSDPVEPNAQVYVAQALSGG